MDRRRAGVLAALALVAVAAPVTAYALDDEPSSRDRAGRIGMPGQDDRGAERRADGRAHAEAMKEWAECVAEAAKDDERTGPPTAACDKPAPPGLAKRDAPPGHRMGSGHGRAYGHEKHADKRADKKADKPGKKADESTE